MRPSTVLLFQTHFFNRWCERAYRSIADACPRHVTPVVLLHGAPGSVPPPRLARVPHHFVTTDQIRYPGYPAKSSGANWNLWTGGHTDLILLHYFRAHPEFERYWVVEYDVRYSGSWRTLIDTFEEETADLIVPSLLRWRDDPEWYNWPSISGPEQFDVEDALRAFLPIFRASRRMVETVDRAYRDGWGGHCEATWPTLAHLGGMALVDPGGHGEFTPERYRGRFYTNDPRHIHITPGTLVFKPALYRVGRRRDMLWHPVKPFFWRSEIREGLRDIKRQAGYVVRGLRARMARGGARGGGLQGDAVAPKSDAAAG
jgi:hypothetical protein